MPSLEELLEQNNFTTKEILFAHQVRKFIFDINNNHRDWEGKRGATIDEIKAEYAKLRIAYPDKFVNETLHKLTTTKLRTGEPCAVLCCAGKKWYSVSVHH